MKAEREPLGALVGPGVLAAPIRLTAETPEDAEWLEVLARQGRLCVITSASGPMHMSVGLVVVAK